MADLRLNNPYSIGVIEEFDNGELSLVRNELNIEIDITDSSFHIVTNFDRIDLLAYEFYKDTTVDASKYWWVIADANNITNPLDLSDFIGSRIYIPDLQKVLLQL